MKALVFDSTLKLLDLPMPTPAPGEALIRVLYAGICRTDLEIVRGYMGFHGILGHEFVGVVERSHNSFLRGKRVVGEINCVCKACTYCNMEMPRHCERRTVLGIQDRPGVFAEYVTLPEENLHLVPKDVQNEMAVFTEPLAAAFRIPEQLSVPADDRVIVLGDGKLGLLAAQVLWLHSKNTLCIGKHPWKLDLLAPLGIPTALNTEPVEGKADIVVEATGTVFGLNRALSLVRPEGTIILKTTTEKGFEMDAVSTVVNEVHIVGSRCGPFRPALEAIATGTVELTSMITAVYPLDDGVEALSRAKDHDMLKVLLHISS
ncbi:MAG: alcohol dehydrogenase catalytic domain-containing protein [Candidatus Hydrogenedentes bacterium]|nr:alcohol dehydrogenase catalytic domain-containing protein [Candidatus Hydrogenedentota bacterium]